MTHDYLESSKSGNDLKESRYETLAYIAKIMVYIVKKIHTKIFKIFIYAIRI